MPTYDYRCQSCNARFEQYFSYEEYERIKVTCPECGGVKVERKIGRIRLAKSDDRRLEEMVDPTQLDGLEDDPKALGRLMRKMGNELGEDAGPEFDEVVSRLEKGQHPDEIEKDLPDLGSGMTDSDDLDY